MSLSVPIASAEHTSAALREGESREDLMEEIRVAAEMRGGAAYAQGTLHWTKWRASPTSVYG